MKWVLFFILMFKMQFLIAQKSEDFTKKDSVLINKLKRYQQRRENKMTLYADSINKYEDGLLPNFLFDECFDWKASLWKNLHSPTSLRWEVLKQVCNKRALRKILATRDKRLKQLCSRKPEKVYPYIVVPMIDKSFYQLIKKRYRQLD